MNRTLVGILLLLGGLLGLFMTACGAFVSVAMVADQASRQYAGILIISLPSLLAGLLLLWFVRRQHQKWNAPLPQWPSPPAPPPPPPSAPAPPPPSV